MLAHSTLDVGAVLTGDLVNSSRLTSEGRRSLLKQVESSPEIWAGRPHKRATIRVDIFRGDSWQMYVAQPALALRLALYLRALVRSRPKSRDLDARIGLGFGTAEFGETGRLADADGPAFRRAAEALEDVAGQASISARFPPRVDPMYMAAFNAMLQLLDIPAQRWTARQAHAVTQALLGRTQSETGTSWPVRAITQQAVAQHLDKAGWSRIEAAIKFAENTLPEALGTADLS